MTGRFHLQKDVFTCKKRGADVGKTKKGKGTKISLLIDGNGIPLSVFTLAANHAEVHTVETLVDTRLTNKTPKRLLYDKAADADWLRKSLAGRGIELICPHRRGRKNPPRRMVAHCDDTRVVTKSNAASVGSSISNAWSSGTNTTLSSFRDSFNSGAYLLSLKGFETALLC